MARDKQPDRDARDPKRVKTHDTSETSDEQDAVPPNPPRTTTHGWTSPKFGSSGSGGAELEPGPERD